MAVRIGILGYGNLGRGIECAIRQNQDMELVAVFTRRDPQQVKIQTEGVSVYKVDQIAEFQDKIDVLMLCGGSATDLPKQTPEYAKYFNVIDSFDTHARIPEHFAGVLYFPLSRYIIYIHLHKTAFGNIFSSIGRIGKNRFLFQPIVIRRYI